MSQAQIITGAHVICYLNGKPFGRVFHFSWNAATPNKEIRGIDCIEALELATTTSSCAGSMGLYRTKGDGGAEGPGIQATNPDLPRGKYFSFMLIERITDTVIFQADFCKVENQSWDVPVKDFVKGSISFKALSWNNECRPNPR